MKDFYSVNILSRETPGKVVAHGRSHEGSNEPRWHGHPGKPCHPGPFGPWWSPRLRLLMDDSVSTEKGRPNFPVIF
jgi:hypothetical protein